MNSPTKPKTPAKVISLRVEDDLHQALKAAAKKDDLTVSQIFRRAARRELSLKQPAKQTA